MEYEGMGWYMWYGVCVYEELKYEGMGYMTWIMCV